MHSDFLNYQVVFGRFNFPKPRGSASASVIALALDRIIFRRRQNGQDVRVNSSDPKMGVWPASPLGYELKLGSAIKKGPGAFSVI